MCIRDRSTPTSRTGTPEPKLVFKDKKEAIEAFKDLLKERVSEHVLLIFNLKFVYLKFIILFIIDYINYYVYYLHTI